jgi:hypothetical protein
MSIELACYRDVATDRRPASTEIREANRSRASGTPVPGEYRQYEQPGQTENTFTRLGNLLGMLDQQAIPEAKAQLVWVGRPIA